MKQSNNHKSHAKKEDVTPLAVNLTKAARLLSVSRPTLRNRILPFLDTQQVGSRILVSVESIKQFLQSDTSVDTERDTTKPVKGEDRAQT
jgi:hypothetical protein